MADFTVIWREPCAAEFRVDYVTAPDNAAKKDVMLAAAKASIEDTLYADDETPPAPESLLEGPYELITIFAGHCPEPFSG